MSLRVLAAMAMLLVPASLARAADSFPFAGAWSITGAARAPWEDPARPIVGAGEENYVGKIVTITPDSIDGVPLLDCGATQFSISALPFAGLFEGGLAADPKDPAGPYDEARAARLARQLGFSKVPVPTLMHGCSEIALHLVDLNTILFGLDNRIYTLKKR